MSGMNRSQSAMEYLMTYGWAILIIAVVLAALFELGVFNPNNISPRAQPGSCHVFRPNGPDTTQFINLEGLCNGELPQFVAQFSGSIPSGSASPGNDIVVAPVSILENFPAGFTVSVWVSTVDGGPIINSGNSADDVNPFIVETSSGDVRFVINNQWSSATQTGTSILGKGWTSIAATYNGVTESIYVNGQISTTAQLANTITGNSGYSLFIGFRSYGAQGDNFYGTIANVQVYNTTLSANEIQALYLEGIGGAPFRLQNLVGWWPLNGNANDYSGNNNNGQINGATFTSSWTNGYTAP